MEEEEWRLKSRVIWIKCGDNNTKFFHNFSNHRRVTNTVWDVVNAQGIVVNSQFELAWEAKTHFQNVFKDPRVTSIEA